MKTLSYFFVFILLALGINTVSAQKSLKDDEARRAAEVTKLVNSGRYTFEAERKGNEAINSAYDLDVSKDTLIVYLPSVGKDAGTPISAKNPGVTCTKFNYHEGVSKKGGWYVTITPKGEMQGDAKDVKKIDMQISREGYTQVTVTRANQNSSVFYGYIKEHAAVFPSNRMAAQ